MTQARNGSNAEGVLGEFGALVFHYKTMRHYLSEKAYDVLLRTLVEGQTLDPSIADEVADAMKTWAMEKGATHYCHWFLPLTGATAEKQEAFLAPDGEGGIIASFSGKELIRGEPDASSFPSGGLRATFEARGYTAWDPTSPAFLHQQAGVTVLCIPTVFCSYHGEALDKKTPLLRSQHALATQLERWGRLFGVTPLRCPRATLGVEQEYFLIDRRYFTARPDLVQTGRTLFGCRPARHQQMEDHYFGHVKPRVLAFMHEVDRELWRLGIPAKTRHNEVSPGQFESASVFEEQNLAVDHNMLTMQVLRETAERHGMACLLHEKPFAGVNGSGKHNNWSVDGPDGRNWFAPGNTPHENAVFLTMIVAVLKAVDTFGDVLRATVASAGNDHRLGANEAPPAIMSVYLGDQLSDILAQIEQGGHARRSKSGGRLTIGVTQLPPLPRDATDRNRTSPFAFTGTKFEFRAVGASQSCAGSNVALNTMMAWALDEMATAVEGRMARGASFSAALQEVLQAEVRAHQRVLFDGDNYSAEWKKEAARRGLSCASDTATALRALITPESEALFSKYGVLTSRELHSRYDAYRHAYEQTVAMEAACAIRMARTLVLPAALGWERELRASLAGSGRGSACRRLRQEVAALAERLAAAADRTEREIPRGNTAALLKGMAAMREAADALEERIPASCWPLPTYGEMLFLL